MLRFYRVWLFCILAVFAVPGCSGGGGTPGTPSPLSNAASVRVGPMEAATVFLAGDTTARIDVPSTSSGSGVMTLQGYATLPAGEPGITVPYLSNGAIYGPSTNAPTPTALAYMTLSVNASVAFAAFPTVSFSLPANAPTSGVSYSLGYYDPVRTVWTLGLFGPSSVTSASVAGSPGTVSFSAVNETYGIIIAGSPPPPAISPLTFVAGRTYGLVLYSVATGS